MTAQPPPFRWRSIALPVLLPTILFSIGEGALLPVIPLVADDLGATLAVAGVVAGALTVGELIGNIPSGPIIARVGERPAMIGGSILSIAGLVLCLLAGHPAVLGAGVFLIGLATAVFGLARHAFLTSFVPRAYRARALSTLGGTFRFGFFVGPFITAVLLHLVGTPAIAFWVHVVACAGAALILLVLPDPERTFGQVRGGRALVERETHGLFPTIRRNRGVLVRLGSGAALIGGLRASRQVILPLWAVSVGVDEVTTAVVIGIAGGVDFALFYTSGAIMDRWGRLWSALPSMIGLGAGHLVLAFTHDLGSATTWFVAAALLLAVANGLGSGILMTLGADLADPSDPAPFLGAWRFTGGIGTASAPLLLSGVTAVAGLAAGAGVLGV
ncbi:MAG TPA: MFS transporter, partial [Rhodoglobus sp.]|nr:MFS transporter [Rhodoglobus sp.]